MADFWFSKTRTGLTGQSTTNCGFDAAEPLVVIKETLLRYLTRCF